MTYIQEQLNKFDEKFPKSSIVGLTLGDDLKSFLTTALTEQKEGILAEVGGDDEWDNMKYDSRSELTFVNQERARIRTIITKYT